MLSASPAAWLSSKPAESPSCFAYSTSSGLTTMARAARDATAPRSAVTAVPTTCWPVSTRPRVRRSDDELIVASRHVDLAGLFERADHTHDARLRLFDGLQLDRAEQLDFLGEVGRRALGHVLHDLVAHLLVDTLERDRELLGVDRAEYELDRTVVEA